MTVQAGSAERRVVQVDAAADARWDAYVAGRRDALVFHHRAWLRTLEREYGTPALTLACETADGELCGILPLMWTRGLPLAPRGVGSRRLASLPRTPVAGPLADDAEAAAALVQAAIERASAYRGAQLQIKTVGDALGDTGAVAGHPWRLTYRIDLPEHPEDLRFGSSRNHSRIRWAVRKAERDGVRVRPAASVADVRAWYPLHVATLQQHVVPPRPLRLFVAMWEEMAPAGLMRLLLAERASDGAVIAGSIVLTYGSTAFYAYNGVRRDALAARPNDLIQWRAIHDAIEAGCSHYDLGEVVEDHTGLSDFKRKWGAREHRLHRYYHPSPAQPPDPGDGRAGAAGRLASAAWKRLPVRATRTLGDLMYRYL